MNSRTIKQFLWVAIASMVAFALQGSAETIVSYDFSINADPTMEAVNTSSTAVDGIGFNGSDGRSTAGNYFGRGPDTNPATSYVAFTITADAGWQLDLTTLDYDYYVQAEGGGSSGGTFSFETRSSVDDFASAIAGSYVDSDTIGLGTPYEHASFDLSGGSYDGLSSIEFRLYAKSNDGYIDAADILRWDNIVVTGSVPVDTTAPSWTDGYPQADIPTSDGFTARAAIHEPGTAYYVVVANGATAPDKDQVKAGNDAGNSPAVASGSITLSAADTEYTAVVTGLSSGTHYDVYFVAEDDETTPNLQASPSSVIDITTADAQVTLDSVKESHVRASASTSNQGQSRLIFGYLSGEFRTMMQFSLSSLVTAAGGGDITIDSVSLDAGDAFKCDSGISDFELREWTVSDFDVSDNTWNDPQGSAGSDGAGGTLGTLLSSEVFSDQTPEGDFIFNSEAAFINFVQAAYDSDKVSGATVNFLLVMKDDGAFETAIPRTDTGLVNGIGTADLIVNYTTETTVTSGALIYLK